MYPEAAAIAELIQSASRVLVIQADNPDSDSLGSALALEQILGDLGKSVWMYCAVDTASYLHYLPGWDRVTSELPSDFDVSIVVDASTETLLEKLQQSGKYQWLGTKPCIVLDHHENVQQPIPFATQTIVDWHRSSAGELIYSLAKQLDWPLNIPAQEAVMTAILGDTQGLSNQLATAQTYAIMAEMVAAGADRPKLEEARREFIKMPQVVFKYKGELLSRSTFSSDGAIVHVTIPQSEITSMSPLYNPGPLVQGDMLQTVGVRVAIVFKEYADGKITASIRCNPGSGIASQLAEKMGGGGHAFASGFKITNGRPFNEVKSECLSYAANLLQAIDQTDQERTDETIQHTYTTG